MSIFGTILSKIFPPAHPAVAAITGSASGPSAEPAESETAALVPPVDVNAVLENLASKNSEQLNWQSSIVDLLKLLGLDSSHDARLSLATELNFSGDTNDSASMNIWLHRVVMQKLEENGCIVPEALKH